MKISSLRIKMNFNVDLGGFKFCWSVELTCFDHLLKVFSIKMEYEGRYRMAAAKYDCLLFGKFWSYSYIWLENPISCSK